MKAPLPLLASTIIICTFLGCASEPMNVGASTEHNNALSSMACVENLGTIYGAIDQYCIENCETNGAVVSAEDISSYIKDGYDSLICPDGGTYTILPVIEKPTCSVPEHTLK